MKYSHKLLLALLLFFLFGVGKSNAVILPDETDFNKSIFLTAKNPTFKIVIPANPTTGFSWFLKDYDQRWITPVSYEFIPPTESIPGRGGTAIWTFKGTPRAFVVPIMTSITFVNARGWEAAGGTERRYTIVTSSG